MPRRAEATDRWGSPGEPTPGALVAARRALQAAWDERDHRYGIGRALGLSWAQVEAVRALREREAVELDWTTKVVEVREWLPRCRVDGRTPSVVARMYQVA